MSPNNFLNNPISTVAANGIPLVGSQVGLLMQGRPIFVKPISGVDGNDGLNPWTAVKTLTYALSLATANQNDTIYLLSESTTASATTDYQSATLTWSKNMVHLSGITAPSKFSQRARIGQLSTATGISPLMNITASSCAFSNFQIFQGVADATSLICMQVTGSRNTFNNVHIAGIGDATMVTAGAMSLKVTGSENVWRDCVIGLDTISRDQNVTEITFASGASRNVFEHCWIDSYISNAGFPSVTIGTNGIDRSLEFDNCIFTTKSTNKAVTQTSVFSIPAISQGAIYLKGGTSASSDGGATDWDSNNRGIIFNAAASPAASGAGGIMTSQ